MDKSEKMVMKEFEKKIGQGMELEFEWRKMDAAVVDCLSDDGRWSDEDITYYCKHRGILP